MGVLVINKRIENHFILYWLPVILYGCLIFYLSSISTLSALPGIKEGTDTFADLGMVSEFWPRLTHFIEYAGFSLLIFRAAYNSKKDWLRQNPFLWALVFASIFGISDEIHQFFIPARSCSIVDWIADTLGALTAQISLRKIMQNKSKKAILSEQTLPN